MTKKWVRDRDGDFYPTWKWVLGLSWRNRLRWGWWRVETENLLHCTRQTAQDTCTMTSATAQCGSVHVCPWLILKHTRHCCHLKAKMSRINDFRQGFPTQVSTSFAANKKRRQCVCVWLLRERANVGWSQQGMTYTRWDYFQDEPLYLR